MAIVVPVGRPAAALADSPAWDIEIHEQRPRPAGAASASHHVDDIVLAPDAAPAGDPRPRRTGAGWLPSVAELGVTPKFVEGGQVMRIALVHGAWADGSSWAAVIRRLQAAGHDVVAPQPLTPRWRTTSPSCAMS